MKRVHAVELEDLAWVPSVLRDGGTDLLDVGFAKTGFYDGVAGQLAALLEATGERHVLDLCSGGGGGTLQLRERLRQRGVRFALTLTDRYPNAAGAARVAALADPETRYAMEPADALSAGGDAPGVRTMSGALHHFRPEDVTRLIGAVVARRRPLAFFDIAASPAIRKLPTVLAPLPVALNMLLLGLGSLALTPFVRPARPASYLFTYAIPLIPALVAWDGTISALRAYTPDELLALARSAPGAAGYRWEAGVAGRALYLTGAPS